MLTRQRARTGVAFTALPPLPLSCVFDVFSRLSLVERLLLTAVSRAWRAALSDPLLWACVDLRPPLRDPLPARVPLETLLRAVVVRASDHLADLRLTVRSLDFCRFHSPKNKGELRDG